MQSITLSRRESSEGRARLLGYFSLALGLAEVAAPRRVAQLIGVKDSAHTRAWLCALGLRELASGVSILARQNSATPLWSRVVGDVVDLNGLSQILWPMHCVQNTRGAEFSPGLRTDRITKVFRKGTDPGIDSYSTFFDNAHRRSTGLDDYLRGHGVREVAILGLATDYCVKFSVLDARELGFDVRVIEDGCRGVNLKPSDSADAIEEMRRAGAAIVTSRTMVRGPS